jgi:hypothetical protein
VTEQWLQKAVVLGVRRETVVERGFYEIELVTSSFAQNFNEGLIQSL